MPHRVYLPERECTLNFPDSLSPSDWGKNANDDTHDCEGNRKGPRQPYESGIIVSVYLSCVDESCRTSSATGVVRTFSHGPFSSIDCIRWFAENHSKPEHRW